MKGMNNISSISQKWVREPSPDPLILNPSNDVIIWQRTWEDEE